MHNKFTLALGVFLLATPALAGGKIGDNTDKVIWEEADLDISSGRVVWEEAEADISSSRVVWEEGDADVKTTKTSL